MDDAERLSRLFLQSLRDGRDADARIQIEALHDVTPAQPRLRFAALGADCELEAAPEAEAG